MSNKEPLLLIDTIYRQTFRKSTRNPELRVQLMSARRIVLTDEMAAFLYSLRLEIILGKLQRPISRRVSYQRVDDCRYFARLPHKITWLEYSVAAMYQREIEIGPLKGTDIGLSEKTHDERLQELERVRAEGARVGWLMYQHDKIETAFAAQCFLGVPEKIVAVQSPVECVWCTDDTPLPWPGLITTDDGESASAFVSGIPGYDRRNVGMRRLDVDRGVLTKNSSHGRAGMMWVFLSTFNKVPIFGEHEVKQSRGFVAQGGYHKFLDHKILTINIPEKAGRKVVRATLALIRRRAHQVRGHWRDDWRLPKGNKSLWIAEHQRGDASLGFVTHDYSVEHETQQ